VFGLQIRLLQDVTTKKQCYLLLAATMGSLLDTIQVHVLKSWMLLIYNGMDIWRPTGC
jgi:hypothetical protein